MDYCNLDKDTMDYHNFDKNKGPSILFRPAKSASIDEDWIREITDMFNNLLEYMEQGLKVL